MKNINLHRLFKKKLSFSGFFTGLAIIIGLVLLIKTGYFFWEHRDVSPQNVNIVVQDKHNSGSQASAQISITALDEHEIEDVSLLIFLKDGETEKSIEKILEEDFDRESFVAVYNIPEIENGEYLLEFQIDTNLGKDSLVKKITVSEPNKIIISTDRPLYKPGQQLQYRTLLLNKSTLKPLAGEKVIISITNPKGDKIFRKELESSVYGICSGSFSFADELVYGDYTINVEVNGLSQEKSVVVKDFVLPKYELDILMDQDLSKPQERISGVVQAKYFFGKAMTGANASVNILVDGRNYSQSGKTDDKGFFSFELEESHLVNAKNISVKAQVSEGGETPIMKEMKAEVSSEPIVLELIPESKSLKPGIENRIVILVSNQNGDPIESTITMTGERLREFATDEFGIAEFSYTPEPNQSFSRFNLRVRDKLGNVLAKSYTLNNELGSGAKLLLGTDKVYYDDGENINLNIRSTVDEPVKLEIIQDEYVVYSDSLKIVDGKAEKDLPVTDNMFGLLELRVSMMSDNASRYQSGSLIRDSKFIIINKDNELRVNIDRLNSSYKPGEEASLSFRVTDEEGNNENSALVVKVVDAALLALEEDDAFSRRLLLMDEKMQERLRDVGGLDWEDLSQDSSIKNRDLLLGAMLSEMPSFKTELSELYKNNNTAWSAYQDKKEGIVFFFVLALCLFGFVQLIRLWSNSTRELDKIRSSFVLTLPALLISLAYVFLWMILFNFTKAFDFVDFHSYMYDFLGFFEYLAEFEYLVYVFGFFMALCIYSFIKFKEDLDENYYNFAKIYLGLLVLLFLYFLLATFLSFFGSGLDYYLEDISILILMLALPSMLATVAYLYLPKTMDGRSLTLKSWFVLALIGLFLLPIIFYYISIIVFILILNVFHTFQEDKGRKDEDLEEVRRYFLEKGKSEEEVDFLIAKLKAGESYEELDMIFPSFARILSEVFVVILLVFVTIFFVQNLLDGPPDSFIYSAEEEIYRGLGNDDPRSIAANRINIVFGLASIVSLLSLLYGFFLRMRSKKYRFGFILKKRSRSFIVAGIVFMVIILFLYVLAGFTFDSIFRATTGVSNIDINRSVPSDSWGSGVGIQDSSPVGQNQLWGGATESIQSRTGLGSDSVSIPFFDSAEKDESPRTGEKKISLGSEDEYKKAERVRRFFPETMYWQSELIAENGQVEFSIPVKDSITKWKISALANSLSGKIGGMEDNFVSFQDFFIKFDLPLNLSVGDELYLPVEVFNYLDVSQNIRLSIREDEWFDLMDNNIERVIPAGDKMELVIGLRIKKYGDFSLRIDAEGTKMADAVEKIVRIQPLGRLVEQTVAQETMKDQKLELQAVFPESSLHDTRKLKIKFYPTVFSQIVEGLDSILRMPNGCFEQVSSSLYPNILVLNYMERTGKTSPEIKKRAEDYINVGLQKILNYEMSGGGFSLYGKGEAETLLSAYGLFQLSNLKDVMYVNDKVINRTKKYLLSKRKSDGSFQMSGYHRGNLQGNSEFVKNAYVIWSLSEADENDEFNLSSSLRYLEGNWEKAKSSNYDLALAANAMQNIDSDSDALGELVHELKLRLKEENGLFYLPMNMRNHYGSYGSAGDIEASSLAAIIFSKRGEDDFANQLIDFIIARRNSQGNWGSTQATMLALYAINNHQSIKSSTESDEGSIDVAVSNQDIYQFVVKPENSDVVQMISFDDNIDNLNNIELSKQGEINTTIQVLKSYYEPWDVALSGFGDNFDLRTSFDYEFDANGNRYLNLYEDVNFLIDLKTQEEVSNAMLDIVIPSGFVVQTDKMNCFKGSKVLSTQTSEIRSVNLIERCEQKNGRLIVYFGDLARQETTFSIPMRPMYEGLYRVLPTRFYSYYDPGNETFSETYGVRVIK